MTDAKAYVLLVDDVEANLVALEAILDGLPCEVVMVRSGNEALRHLLKREFAVILLDVQMPEMDGYEVARHARTNPMTAEIPIIFLTAMNETPENVFAGYKSGAVDCLFKPVNPYVLRSKVSVFLELQRGKRHLSDEIAAHKTTLADLAQSNDSLRHFTHAAAHDLRAPLRTIQGFLGILTEDARDRLDAEQWGHVERVISASQRLDSLLDALLVYAKLQASRAWGQVDCNEVVEQVKADLATRIASARAIVEAAGLPTVNGDASRIYQLFLNLIANAMKFSRPEEAPRIAVSAHKTPEGLDRFVVADNGIGIDEQFAAAIFEPFRRLHSHAQYEGTGLGLAICRGIVEQHGGKIWAEPNPPQGTRFLFTLASA